MSDLCLKYKLGPLPELMKEISKGMAATSTKTLEKVRKFFCVFKWTGQHYTEVAATGFLWSGYLKKLDNNGTNTYEYSYEHFLFVTYTSVPLG